MTVAPAKAPLRFAITIDHSRDNLLTDFGKATLKDRYLLPGESYQDLFARVACAYADDAAHAQRLYTYMSLLWFMPATPVLANGGADRGLPISCYVNEVEDSLEGIDATFRENFWLAAKGGGIGTDWSNVRSIGEKVHLSGETSGIMPFIKMMDSQTLAVAQGNLRRGSAATYLRIDHPEIEEFIEMRRPTGGDPNRRSLNLHHGVVISDAFMRAVENNQPWNLVSPRDGSVQKTVGARDLWIRILTARIETGEPYIIFSDTINAMSSEVYKAHGLKIKNSNLCLTGDTKIVTNLGIRTLRSLYESQEDFTVISDTRSYIADRKNPKGGWLPKVPVKGVSEHKSTRVFCTATDAPVFKVTTFRGRELRGTADHPVLTNRGWVRIGDLTEGDKIAVQSGEGLWGSDAPPVIEDMQASNHQIGRLRDSGVYPPVEWDEETGEVLGWFTGDGYFERSNGHIGIAFGDKDTPQIERVRNKLEAWFPGRTHLYKQGNCVHLRVTDNRASAFFQQFGLKVTYGEEKQVPTSIFNAPRPTVVGYLRGLFSADGSVSKSASSCQIGLVSTSHTLLKETQTLLDNLGIFSSIRLSCSGGFATFPAPNGGRTKEYPTRNAWVLRIGRKNRDRFLTEVAFLQDYKNQSIEDYLGLLSPMGSFEEHFYDEVVSVDADGTEDVYDITVEGSHSFIANGIVVHNCSEIFLATGPDQLGGNRSSVCCLSSLNLDYYLDWKSHPTFIEDVMRFLDNVMQDFIDRAPDTMARARYSAMRERSVGLGVMGFHSFLQSLGVPFESAVAKSWNLKMFKHIKEQADAASVKLAQEKGPCPDAADAGLMVRFANKTAIAPTASISIICGGASPGIEPSAANSYAQKTLSGTHVVRNPHLKRVLAKHGKDDAETWTSIGAAKGSVQHLDFLSQQEKDTFKTAIELDQRWLIEHAADRTPFIDQGQSLNLFFAADAHKKDINDVHMMAWRKGLKGLYYCRSLSVQRAETVSEKIAQKTVAPDGEKKYDECLACQ